MGKAPSFGISKNSEQDFKNSLSGSAVRGFLRLRYRVWTKWPNSLFSAAVFMALKGT